MESLMVDIRYGIKILLKKPGFTAVAVVALALGIGANTTIFSVVNAVLIRPLPYKDPGRLVWVWENNLQKNMPINMTSPANFSDWKDQNGVFEQITAFEGDDFTLTGKGEPERLLVTRVFGNFFDVLGTRPVMGRLFLPEEDTPSGKHVAILGNAFWRSRFGSDPNLIGNVLT